MSETLNGLPEKNCDIVMKGGITSGVVYPLAAHELSKTFRFKNIGGTSAGAIAAAAVAAAEYGRTSAHGGFELLKALPDLLGEKMATRKTRLFHFFQPQIHTKPVFDIVAAALSGGGISGILCAIIKSFAAWLVLGTVAGLLLVWSVCQVCSGQEFSYEILVRCLFPGILFGLIFGTLLVVLAIYRSFCRCVPGNFFGLCSGMEGIHPKGALALTPWLMGFFNRLAGRAEEDAPLTFGDLWGTNDARAVRAVNLEMMTTCLTHGRPYRLPFRDDDGVHENRRFFFKKEEFLHLFPKHVVQWLVDHPRAPDDDNAAIYEADLRGDGFLPLPEPWNLPIIVAVRMSLSFPLLLSAVPLHAADFSRKEKRDQKPEKCWFSDGGISSNFPIHFFDSPLPRWPTFAMNLSEKHPDYPAGAYLPKHNSAGILEHWTRFNKGSGCEQLMGFIGSIMGTMQNWADNAQTRLPGFRDRIATISLEDKEGGLNLNMSAELIACLGQRGKDAAAEFAKRFATTSSGCDLDWENHRWTRMRATLAALEEMLERFETGCADPRNGDIPYEEWVRATGISGGSMKPPSYPWCPRNTPTAWDRQRLLAEETIMKLRKCAQELKAACLSGTKPLSECAPRPRAELRVRPRI